MNDTKGGTAMFNLEPVYVFSEKLLPWALPFHDERMFKKK